MQFFHNSFIWTLFFICMICVLFRNSFCALLLFSHDSVFFTCDIFMTQLFSFYDIFIHISFFAQFRVIQCNIFTVNSFSHMIFEWVWRHSMMWSVWGRKQVKSGLVTMEIVPYDLMCSTMWSVQVCSLLPLCIALVILADSDISVVVSLHPLEFSFSQTALLTWWSLHPAWGEQNRLHCWEEAYIYTCKTISLRHHFHIIVFPQQEEQYLSSEAYQWEQQVRSLEH